MTQFKKDVPYLKEIIKDGMELLTPNPEDHVIIRRYPNNIIKINNKPIAWVKLHELLVSCDYVLKLDEKQAGLFDDATFEFEKKHGGVRVAGPGRTIGRNKIDPAQKKKVCSFGLTPDAQEKLKIMCSISGRSKSEEIEQMIQQRYLDF